MQMNTEINILSDKKCSLEVEYATQPTFYYLLFLAETFMMCGNVFYVHATRNEISAGSDKKWEISP